VPDSGSLRASDADREAAVAELRRHLEDGRLTVDEFSDRVDRAYEARTLGELADLRSDLPATHAGPERRRRALRRSLPRVVALLVLVNGVAIAVWATSGADSSFWPKWVLLASGIRLGAYLLRTTRHSLGLPPPPPPPPPPLDPPS
jgi:hypothetical protein